ncbi:MAG: hypothetical protein Wins2KO_22220 [Winogradskyella sp.]
MKHKPIITKIHLVISVIIVIPAAVIYGFEPQSLLDMLNKTIDEHNFSKAVMGIYLSFSILWLTGLFKSQYLKYAIITNIFFMLGLGIGRVISINVDGFPTTPFLLGTLGELILGFYGVWLINSKYIEMS